MRYTLPAMAIAGRSLPGWRGGSVTASQLLAALRQFGNHNTQLSNRDPLNLVERLSVLERAAIAKIRGDARGGPPAWAAG